jgi:hypothetical protein
MIEMTCGNIVPLARPWRTRPTISTSGVGAIAHSADVAVKPAMPNR